MTPVAWFRAILPIEIRSCESMHAMDGVLRAAPAAIANSSRALEPAFSTELSSIVDRLQAAGRCSDVALASLGVVRLFEAWVAVDASTEGSDSLAQVQQAVEHDANPLHLVGYSGNWGLWRHDLVSRQRADTEAVARAAIQSSRHLLDMSKESPCEKTSPYTLPGASSSLSSASIGTDGFMRSEFGSGRVVYGSGYNSILKGFPKWTYADLDGEKLAKQELWSTLRNNLGVNLLSCRLFPSKVLMPDLSFAASTSFNECISTLNASLAHGAKVHILVSNSLPEWAYDLYPDLSARGNSGNGRVESFQQEFKQHSVDYDIDHPQAIRLMTAALQGAARLIGCHPALAGWILANEPTFRGTPSSHTAGKYSAFLEEKYNGDVSSLNFAWGSQLEWFDKASTSPLKPDGDDIGSGARRMWLDWCSFNSQRVTTWIRALRKALRDVSACHLCSVKFNTWPNFAVAPLDSGIDRVTLLRELDITGLDSGFSPPSTSGYSHAVQNGQALTFYHPHEYTSDWLSVAVELSMLKSIAPTKLILNSEWHLVTDCCRTPRERYGDATFTSARVWFTTIMGQGAHLVWYWGREHDGLADTRLPRSFPECILTQPIVMDALHRTHMAMNSNSEALASLASAEPIIWILYSRESHHASGTLFSAIFAVVQALTFMGVPFGFLPSDGNGHGLDEALGKKGATNWVVVAGCTHLEGPAVHAIKRWYERQRGQLLLVGSSRDELLRFWENGFPMPWPERGFVYDEAIPFLDKGRPQVMLERLEHELQPDRVGSRLAFCQESEHQGARIGVFCRAALDPNRPGVSYIALLNMRPVEAHVHLKISDSLRATCGNRFTDLLSGQKGSSEEIIPLKANKFMLLMFAGGSAYSSPSLPSMPVHPAPPPALPQPQSAQRVCVYDIKATNVPVQDEGKFGTSDPSLRLLMDGKRVIGQTEARYNTESPHWEETFCFNFFSTVSAVSIELHDDWPSENPTLLDSGAFYLERAIHSIHPIVKRVLLSRGTVIEFSIKHPDASPAEPDYSSVPPSFPLMPSPHHTPISPPATPPSCPTSSPPLNYSYELLPNDVVSSTLGAPPEPSPTMHSPSAIAGISNQSIANDHGESAYQDNNRTSTEQINFGTPDSFNSSISSTMPTFNIGFPDLNMNYAHCHFNVVHICVQAVNGTAGLLLAVRAQRALLAVGLSRTDVIGAVPQLKDLDDLQMRINSSTHFRAAVLNPRVVTTCLNWSIEDDEAQKDYVRVHTSKLYMEALYRT